VKAEVLSILLRLYGSVVVLYVATDCVVRKQHGRRHVRVALQYTYAKFTT